MADMEVDEVTPVPPAADPEPDAPEAKPEAPEGPAAAASSSAAADAEDDADDESGEEGEYEVEKILAKRTRKGVVQYKVRWAGFPSEDEDTWEPLENLGRAKDQVDAYEGENKKGAKRKKTEKAESTPAEKQTNLMKLSTVELAALVRVLPAVPVGATRSDMITALQKVIDEHVPPVEPEKKKRPQTKYNLFMKEHLSKFKADNPNVEHKKAFQIMADLWKKDPTNPANQPKPAEPPADDAGATVAEPVPEADSAAAAAPLPPPAAAAAASEERAAESTDGEGAAAAAEPEEEAAAAPETEAPAAAAAAESTAAETTEAPETSAPPMEETI